MDIKETSTEILKRDMARLEDISRKRMLLPEEWQYLLKIRADLFKDERMDYLEGKKGNKPKLTQEQKDELIRKIRAGEIK